MSAVFGMMEGVCETTFFVVNIQYLFWTFWFKKSQKIEYTVCCYGNDDKINDKRWYEFLSVKVFWQSLVNILIWKLRIINLCTSHQGTLFHKITSQKKKKSLISNSLKRVEW